jgi:hypothetical protein
MRAAMTCASGTSPRLTLIATTRPEALCFASQTSLVAPSPMRESNTYPSRNSSAGTFRRGGGRGATTGCTPNAYHEPRGVAFSDLSAADGPASCPRSAKARNAGTGAPRV